MSVFIRIKNGIIRRYAFWCVNKRFVGTKCFEKKAKALRKAGYVIGKNTKIVGPIYVTAKLEIGENCWIGKDFQAQGNGKVIIGDNCDIGPEVIINTGGHYIGESDRRASEGIINTISIGSGTWVGLRATIINNTNIGKGNVIAAGAVVISSSKDNVLLAGVPAVEKKVLD